MSADRELLKLAAKAAGIAHDGCGFISASCIPMNWNPLTDDGDALRLAVQISALDGGVALMLNSRFNSCQFAQCYTNENVIAPSEYMKDDPCDATRRVIVLAAAEIGKKMP